MFLVEISDIKLNEIISFHVRKIFRKIRNFILITHSLITFEIN